ncbi:hypothetical protein CROQUDRAFT_100757 [Cronartium quercuum f. sp. fusiforme G11]|uniref:Uncharacterized protein n=1 Tax=Cronartium quercuum f. sp. fusiforme G11 TaxID=708437 RepID=A0A9P6T5K7_9BASI|nr:hypothetical protein CROQUDRAFT_100757 [Cronartium quercuum f. sp. fusiforme G11]
MVFIRNIYKGEKSKQKTALRISIPDIPPDKAATLFQNLGFFGSQTHPSHPAIASNNQELGDTSEPEHHDQFEGLDLQPADDELNKSPLNPPPNTPLDLLIQTLKAKEYTQKQY